VDFVLADGGVADSAIAPGSLSLQGNRFHFRIAPPNGDYQPSELSVNANGKLGVEVCEGLAHCEADIDARINTPINWTGI
jgi:hypothetical protein